MRSCAPPFCAPLLLLLLLLLSDVAVAPWRDDSLVDNGDDDGDDDDDDDKDDGGIGGGQRSSPAGGGGDKKGDTDAEPRTEVGPSDGVVCAAESREGAGDAPRRVAALAATDWGPRAEAGSGGRDDAIRGTPGDGMCVADPAPDRDPGRGGGGGCVRGRGGGVRGRGGGGGTRDTAAEMVATAAVEVDPLRVLVATLGFALDLHRLFFGRGGSGVGARDAVATAVADDSEGGNGGGCGGGRTRALVGG